MADYTSITETATDPDAPVTTGLMKALRDNPIAIAEGASGAPRVQYNAMGSWFDTTGGLGTYAFLAYDVPNGGNIAQGTVVSGSSLSYAGIGGPGLVVSGSSPSGTWKLLGRLINPTGTDIMMAAIWQRVT